MGLCCYAPRFGLASVHGERSYGVLLTTIPADALGNYAGVELKVSHDAYSSLPGANSGGQ
jgi:hypothetical protein